MGETSYSQTSNCNSSDYKHKECWNEILAQGADAKISFQYSLGLSTGKWRTPYFLLLDTKTLFFYTLYLRVCKEPIVSYRRIQDKLAAHKINAKGGILGRNIVFVTRDSKFKVDIGCPEAGWILVEVGEPDFTPYITAILSAKPDAVIVATGDGIRYASS